MRPKKSAIKKGKENELEIHHNPNGCMKALFDK